ncbi:MAG: bifunctional (p)ppGpp synthetase/guanosine-3',5'-bis(diphosphate) 3'-pyrophosphohydrolase [Candidatus Desulforudis sp.]|nr:bifunctional (p)ppGpp synthetase/guanosine-3',5'-bis(diphosphate) 3'-pyrophosphohydrolase [Desulforudis sp.]
MAIEPLVTRIQKYNPHIDVSVLQRAYEFAFEAHHSQKRISGEDFIEHPLEVARILAELELDVESVVGGLLHDTMEDAGVDLCVIREEFGDEVALLVDGVTKLRRLSYRSKEEQQAENLRKMFLAMAKDVRVILIKLADRLHNLRTLQYHSIPKQREIAQETLEIFAPLAHRLGIYRIKWEIEDIAFRHREPEKYYELAHRLSSSRGVREEYIEQVIELLRGKLGAMGIVSDIQGRPKHLYSIYQKMLEQQKDLNEIFDILGIRVLVDTVKDCYAAVGVIHTLWKPVPGRFKDFIAMPKSNMYQSLHTSVIGPEGEILEIQIRTRDMHRTAEYGIAAHWRYKTGVRDDPAYDEKLAWLRQILEWQHELRDAREFMETLKIDLFADSVYVFTPMGDVLELPNGAVPLDFAYRIHTDLGHRCIGARVNGKLVSLNYRLQTGDIVDIIKAKQPSPSRDWLNVVKTSQAKTKIRQWFKREQREENVNRGREALEREARKQGVEVEHLRGERMLELGKRYTLHSVEDIYAAVGLGVVAAGALVSRLKEQTRLPRPDDEMPEVMVEQKRWSKSTQGIRVLGIDNLLVRLAHCCNPVPGDPIVGYITRGRGVSVHREDCRNMGLWREREQERLVSVAWDKQFNASFQLRLAVSGMDRAGLLRDVMNVLSEMKISARWVTARGDKSKMATIDLTIEINNLEQLEYLRQRLNKVRDVYEVRRMV